MKPLNLTILLGFILMNAAGQNATISILKADSGSMGKITIVHFENSLGVIFPASYAQEAFGENIYWKNKHFITVDSYLIRHIDTALVQQYCLAIRRFIDKNWEEEKAYLQENETKKEYRKAKEFHNNQVNLFDKYCPTEQNRLKSKFKQYIGFINENGEKVVYINILNFEDDQYNLKTLFTKAWIYGSGDWFEKNAKSFYFNVDKNLLTVNEDI